MTDVFIRMFTNMSAKEFPVNTAVQIGSKGKAIVTGHMNNNCVIQCTLNIDGIDLKTSINQWNDCHKFMTSLCDVTETVLEFPPRRVIRSVS